MVLIPSKPFGKVMEKHPTETKPAWRVVWRSLGSPTVVDEAQMSSQGGSYSGDVPAFLTTNSAPVPSGLPCVCTRGSVRLGLGNNLCVFALTFRHSQHTSNGAEALENN